MSKDYVSKELARKLQEKGFPLKKVYRQDGRPIFYDLPQDHPDWSQCDAWYLPTIWVVLKWLREEKNIEVVASFSYRNKVWGCQVGDMTLSEDSILSYDYSFPTYEEAALAGVTWVLDNLI